MNRKKTPPKSAEASAPHTGKGPFKQALQKPEPWSFGGRGPRSGAGGSNRPQPDAERRAGKSRKVH